MGSAGTARVSTGTEPHPGDFGDEPVVLIAAVMKADGKVLKSELDYVKRFFVSQFGHDTAQEALTMLRDLLKKDIPLRDVCIADKERNGLPLKASAYSYVVQYFRR